ncbi:hypothetical protein [Bartonella sp. MR100HLJHH]|uniref:hypothetical protein n=1 Tax=Bartonella sp. MR100HLJHH TaxID=3243554 RepID=UPI0035CF59DB
MHFVLVEASTFDLARLIEAAETLALHLHLLTHNKDLYFYELDYIKSVHLSVIERDTFHHAEMITYCQNLKNFSGILNLTDTWATSVNDISAQLGYKTQNAYAINICRDKACLRKILCEKGLTKGQITVIESEAFQATHKLSYPVILKDPQGTNSKNV